MAVAMAVIIASHASNLTEALTVVMLGGLLQPAIILALLGSVDSLLTTRMSGVLRALLLLTLLLGLGRFVEPIPHAVWPAS